MLCLYILLSSFVRAQSGTEFNDISLEGLLDLEISGSTLTLETQKTVPSAVTVFGHEEIKRLGVDQLTELMALAPGFQSYRSSSSALQPNTSVRGHHNKADILVVVDGKSVFEPRQGNALTTLSTLNLKDIERIEFIRGPGSAVYGSNAMLGTINIVTRSGVREVGVGYGTHARRNGHAFWSQTVGEVLIDAFIEYDQDNGDTFTAIDSFNGGFSEISDPLQKVNADLKLRWRLTQFQWRHYQNRTEDYYELNNVAEGINKRQTAYGAFSITQYFDLKKVASELSIGYDYAEGTGSFQLTRPGALAAVSVPASTDALTGYYDTGRPYFYYAKLRNDFLINNQANLIFGIDYYHYEVKDFKAFNNFDMGALANGTFPLAYYGNFDNYTLVQRESRRDVLGMYTQLQYDPFEKTHLTLGLRYDMFSSLDSQMSPRVAVVQEVFDNHSIKLLYGKAFRAPAEVEMNFTNNWVILGNQDLDPETVQSYELIWVSMYRYFGFMGSVGYFENHYKDTIDRIATGTKIQYGNSSLEATKGFEFEYSQQFATHWYLRGNYTLITNNDDADFREADRFGSTTVNYNRGRLNMNVSAAYQGSREMAIAGSEDTRMLLHNYWLFHSKVGYDFYDDWSVSLQIKNMFDKDYLTPSSNTSIAEGIANRGREYMVGITREF
jgi:outer membrane receptor for ferrienterochelin and colicin